VIAIRARVAPDTALCDKKMVNPQNEILTAQDVARELRCSVDLVYKVINGKVRNVSPPPAIPMGRRKLVQRAALQKWKRVNEKDLGNGKIPPPKADAARRKEEETHAQRVSER
jgi:hypothetical protein